MASVVTVRTDEEQLFIDHVLGESLVNMQSFENLRQAACVDAKRRALVRVLKEFDEFCDSVGVRYFLFAETLRGVVAYGDFLPGKDAVQIGMMRSEYKRFARAYQARAKSLGHAPFAFWYVEEHDSVTGKTLRRFPRLRVSEPVPVMYSGDPVFDKDSLPMTVSPFAEISIFDEVPDDFFMRKKFYRQMQRRNRFYGRTVKAHELFFARKALDLTEEEALERAISMNFFKALAYAVVPLRFSSWIVRKKAMKYEGRGTEYIARVMGSRSKTIYASDLGECSRRPFAGLSLRCPDKPDAWAMEPISETTPELKRLQDDAKMIVQEIDRVCKELGIGYFCCGGTMLGYVRHGGFIPWDDDIDIGMLREDYEIFKKHAVEYIDTEKFFVQTRESDPNIPYLFSKVRLNGSEYITEYNKDRDFHKGICVDVFPFDYIPNGRSHQEAFKKEAKKAARAHHKVVNRQYPEAATRTTEKRKNLDWLIAQINGRILAKHYWGISLNETQRSYDETVTRYDASAKEDGLQYVASFVPTYTMVKVDGDLLPYQRVDFDGIQVNLPARPEVFLRMQYGDYMVMPYPHQRAGHDLLLWSDDEGVGGGRMADV